MAAHINAPEPFTGRAGRLAGGLAFGVLALVVGVLFGPAVARGGTSGGLGTAFTALYVPDVRGLPEGFIGAALITSSSPVAAASTALRYPRGIDLPSRSGARPPE